MIWCFPFPQTPSVICFLTPSYSVHSVPWRGAHQAHSTLRASARAGPSDENPFLGLPQNWLPHVFICLLKCDPVREIFYYSYSEKYYNHPSTSVPRLCFPNWFFLLVLTTLILVDSSFAGYIPPEVRKRRDFSVFTAETPVPKTACSTYSKTQWILVDWILRGVPYRK